MAQAPSIQLHVELEAPETLRDIISFLNHCIDAAGPIDVSADARALRDRLDTAVTSGKLRIVIADTNQEVTVSPTDNQ